MARRFQFRLRTILVAVALVGVGCIATQLAVREYREWALRERIRLQREQTDKMWDSRGMRSLR